MVTRGRTLGAFESLASPSRYLSFCLSSLVSVSLSLSLHLRKSECFKSGRSAAHSLQPLLYSQPFIYVQVTELTGEVRKKGSRKWLHLLIVVKVQRVAISIASLVEVISHVKFTA